MKIIAYTDGACSGNPGPGGFGIIICDEDLNIKEKISKSVKSTTNNKMELIAILTAMEYAIANKISEIDIYSDSAYCVNTINCKWLQNWILNGWKTAKNEEVKNRDLWEHFIKIAPKVKFRLYKVKGHEDDELNNMADELAVKAREAIENAID